MISYCNQYKYFLHPPTPPQKFLFFVHYLQIHPSSIEREFSLRISNSVSYQYKEGDEFVVKLIDFMPAVRFIHFSDKDRYQVFIFSLQFQCLHA